MSVDLHVVFDRDISGELSATRAGIDSEHFPFGTLVSNRIPAVLEVASRAIQGGDLEQLEIAADEMTAIGGKPAADAVISILVGRHHPEAS